MVKNDDCLAVLIDIPKYDRPLDVSRAEIRWSDGQDFGMEFIQMELQDQQRLGETIRAIEVSPGRETPWTGLYPQFSPLDTVLLGVQDNFPPCQMPTAPGRPDRRQL